MKLSQHRQTLILTSLIVGFVLLCFCLSAHAEILQPPDPSSFGDTSHGFYKFFQGVHYAVYDVIHDKDLTNFSLILWKFFAVMSIIWLMVLYSMNGVTFPEFFTLIFMLLITRLLMNQYDTLTTALWGWSEGFAGGIQQAVTGHNDLFWLCRYIWNACTSLSFGISTWLHPLRLIPLLIVNAITALLVLLGAFATVWALWGYALAKMIGFMFIPLLLFDRFSWLFDGWCRFFIGFLLYNIIARANLMLVVVALQEYFNLPTQTIPTQVAMTFSIHSFASAIGLLSFLVLGVAALFSTGGFVRSILSGSHIGPASGLRSAAGTAGKALELTVTGLA